MFIFVIFPNLDITRSILVMNVTSLLPSILKLFTDLSNYNKEFNTQILSQPPGRVFTCYKTCMFHILSFSKRYWKVLLININTISIFMQLSFLVVIFSTYVDEELKWKIPIGIILVSIAFSFYFFHLDSTGESKVLKVVKNFKYRVDKAKHKIGLFTNLWKIGIILLFSHIFYPNYLLNTSVFVATPNATLVVHSDEPEASQFSYFAPYIIQLSSSLVFYMATSLSFKLRMNRVCFAFPLTLVTPIMFALSIIVCELNQGNYWPGVVGHSFICERVSSNGLFTIFGICLWWTSHLWTCSNIWREAVATDSHTTNIKRYAA